MTKQMRQALLGPATSRRNKIALLAQCRLGGDGIPWGWGGEPYSSRLLVNFGAGWVQCQSYDEDVRPLLDGGGR